MAKLWVALLLFLCASNTLQHIPRQQFINSNNKTVMEKASSKNEGAVLNIKPGVKSDLTNATNILKQNESTLVRAVEVPLDKNNNSIMTSIEPGADIRLLSVISFIALSCLIFVGFKIYR